VTNSSVAYMLKTAFDYEIRNYIDIQIIKINNIENPEEKDADKLRKLEMIRKYLMERIGEMS
jgi:hypothetical protein